MDLFQLTYLALRRQEDLWVHPITSISYNTDSIPDKIPGMHDRTGRKGEVKLHEDTLAISPPHCSITAFYTIGSDHRTSDLNIEVPQFMSRILIQMYPNPSRTSPINLAY